MAATLKRLLCPTLPLPGHPVELPDHEAHHAIQVLRLRNGEKILALDGRGGGVEASLRFQSGKRVFLDYQGQSQEKLSQNPDEQIIPLTLEMCVLKGDAMEWVVEKAVELGVSTLIPVLTNHTVVQVGKKGPESFRERWQKIADQALKQCGRLTRMEVQLPVELEELLSRGLAEGESRIWCDEAGGPFISNEFHELPPSGALRVLVGPEGGWSAQERDMLLGEKIFRVSLGPLILRAETAALFAVSLAVARLRGNKVS